MPWRKCLHVAAAVAAAVTAFVAAAALMHAGWRTGGTVLLVVAVVGAVFALQAYWVRFDLPWPLGSLASTIRSSSGTGARRALGPRAVAVTFDDGPGEDTPALLDALDRAEVRATFFVFGRAAIARPDLVREIARRGHVVASHGHTHRKLHLASSGTIAREIDAGLDAIRAAGVEPVPLFRAPHGFKGPLLANALRRRGLRLVAWTLGVWDSESLPASILLERATRAMRGGTILLLHDGNPCAARMGIRGATVAAIGEIADRWRASGYEFVTLERLAAPPRSRADQAPAPAAGMALKRLYRLLPDPTRALRWFAILALLVLALHAAQQIDFSKVARALGSASVPELIAAAGANILALAMQSGRWLAVVHPVEPRARPSDAFFALVAGYAIGLVIPARASDLARAHLMSRRSGGSTATFTTTAVVDHLLGLIALLSALGAAAVVWPLPAWIQGAGVAAAAVALTLLVALWLVRPSGTSDQARGAGVAARPRPAAPVGPAATPPAVPGKSTGNLLVRLRTGLTAVGRPRAIGIALAFAVAGWVAEALIAHLALAAFGLPSGVAPSMMAVVATTLSAALSVSPGNAGAFEIACVLALAGFGVPREAALAFAIGYHCVHLIPTAVIGGGWLLGTGFRPAMLRSVS